MSQRNFDDGRLFTTFEEFERESLRYEAGSSVEDLFDDDFAQELDFDGDSSKSRNSYDDDDDDE